MQKLISYIKKQRRLTSHRFSSQITHHKPIQKWQARFFADIIFFLVSLSFIIFIPSFVLAIKDNLLVIAVFDALALAAIIFIFIKKNLTILTRKIILLIDLYLLGIILLFYLGWSGPGLVYFLAFSTFAAVILNAKAGYITWAFNIVVFVAFAVVAYTNSLNNPLLTNLKPEAIITIGLNFIILNLILIITISSLIKGLQSKIISEKESRQKLLRETKMHQKAREKAQESDQLKTAFLSNMSHEIRTPMNGILGFTQLLKNPNLTEEKREQFISIIEQSGDRLLSIINDLIDIAKIEAKQMPIQFSHTNINNQIDYLLEFFKPEATTKEININILKALPDNDAYIYTDKEKLLAILTNLLKNAIKCTNQGYVIFGYSQNNNILEFFVKDTGIGVPKEKHKAIFERFIQADVTDSRNLQGAGLGLSIAKAYAEMLGGKIWIDSEPNVGSTFYFTIKLINSNTKSAHNS